jgi:hypothetical protein
LCAGQAAAPEVAATLAEVTGIRDAFVARIHATGRTFGEALVVGKL